MDVCHIHVAISVGYYHCFYSIHLDIVVIAVHNAYKVR